MNPTCETSPDAPEVKRVTPLTRTQSLLLICAAVLYALIYACLWPRINTTMDESSYLGFAYVLKHGTIFADVARAPVLLAMQVKGHLVSKYPLGMSAILALFSVGGWTFALGVNLFVHLLNYVVVIRLLRRMGGSPLFALLYLLHPTAVLYSRTVMSDLASGLMIALAFDRYLSRKYVQTGALVGAGVLLRTGNIVALPILMAAAALDVVGPALRRQAGAVPAGQPATLRPQLISAIALALRVFLGCLPLLLVAAYYAVVIAGGQMARNTGSFGLEYFPRYFPGYVVCLMALFPGMLLAPALLRVRGRFAIVALCYSFVLLYSFWYYRDSGSNAAESLIIGQRYFLAVLPLLITAYGVVLTTWWRGGVARRAGQRTRGETIAWVAVSVILLTLALLVSRQHDRRLRQMIAVRDTLFADTAPSDVIYCNIQIGKLIPAWSDREFAIAAPGGQSIADLRRWVAAHPATVRTGIVPSPHAVIAYWVRPGRADDAEDAKNIFALERAFVTEPAPVRDVTSPAVVEYVVGERTGSGAAGTSGAPSRPDSPPATNAANPVQP